MPVWTAGGTAMIWNETVGVAVVGFTDEKMQAMALLIVK